MQQRSDSLQRVRSTMGLGADHTLVARSTTAYALMSFNVIKYAGQTVQLYFTGTENSWLATNFYIDDVAVQ